MYLCKHVRQCDFITAVVIHKFVRDMYSKRFPELESLVHTPLEYIKTVQVYTYIMHLFAVMTCTYSIVRACLSTQIDMCV